MAGRSRQPLDVLSSEIEACRLCPRLVEWREEVARTKRAAYRDEEYWGRPVAGFGDPAARIVFLGLAPGAHGANRTGRVFTGDRSGEWLYRALHRAGLASQPDSSSRGDGLELSGAWVTVAFRFAPPGNAPSPDERRRCAPFLARELVLLGSARTVVCLGAFALAALADVLEVRPRPRFAHGAVLRVGRYDVVCSYHPSQQNTFTGTLTERMLDDVVAAAVRLSAG